MSEFDRVHYPKDLQKINHLASSINRIGIAWSNWLGKDEIPLSERLSDYLDVTFKLDQKGLVVGFATLTSSRCIRKASEIASIYVDPIYQRKGLARQMVEDLTVESRNLGFDVITALVNPSGSFIKVLSTLDFQSRTVGYSLIMGKKLH